MAGITIFISELELVSQIAESIVDRSCREHKHLGVYAGADHMLQQYLIAVQLIIFTTFAAVSEVVTFINNQQVIVAPVQAAQIDSIRKTMIASKISVVKDIVAKTIFHKRIVQEIASLLGETAAETKIALTKLKESMSDE